jgi:hypothetical protein
MVNLYAHLVCERFGRFRRENPLTLNSLVIKIGERLAI